MLSSSFWFDVKSSVGWCRSRTLTLFAVYNFTRFSRFLLQSRCIGNDSTPQSVDSLFIFDLFDSILFDFTLVLFVGPNLNKVPGQAEDHGREHLILILILLVVQVCGTRWAEGRRPVGSCSAQRIQETFSQSTTSDLCQCNDSDGETKECFIF